MALLEIKNLTKSFAPGQNAVNNVSLSILEREIVCLLGPSGCGKTTLLRSIAGLEIPDQGEIYFDKKNILPLPPFERDFGMMFQDFALFPHKNVFENIAFGLKMHHENPEAIKSRVEEMLDLVELSGYGARGIEQLSGGEQQRVALARALAPRPRLLMLDEPLGALDRALRERLMLDLRAILKRVGVTAIYVTHDQTEAFAIADRIAVMKMGSIEQIDSPQDLYYQPKTQFVAQFLGMRNLLYGRMLAPDKVQTTLGNLRISPPAVSAGNEVTLLIRPDAGRILPEESAGKENVFQAQLKALSFRGRYCQVWVEIADQQLMFELSRINLEPGEIIYIAIDPTALQVLNG